VDFPLLFPLLSFFCVFFYLINIHTSDGQHKEPQQCREQQCYQPTTATPPTLEQVLSMQALLLRTMQQTMVNMQNAQHQTLPPQPRDRLRNFQCTKPPTFSHSIEPMDVDNWLKSVEKKLQVV
jgi:hypothetical protein